MKKICVFLLSVGLMAAAVQAADQATSVNIVGFDTITCETGKWVLVSAAFESLDGQVLNCRNVISNQLPKGSSVITYDSTLQAYTSDNKSGIGLGTWSTNITFAGGMGFWIYVPTTATSNTYNVVFAGQVPMSSLASNTVNNGFNLLGFPYTASVVFSNTSLYASSIKGDSIIFWDGTAYESYSKTGIGAGTWPVAAKAKVITPQTGYWYKSSTNQFINVESRPYSP